MSTASMTPPGTALENLESAASAAGQAKTGGTSMGMGLGAFSAIANLGATALMAAMFWQLQTAAIDMVRDELRAMRQDSQALSTSVKELAEEIRRLKTRD